MSIPSTIRRPKLAISSPRTVTSPAHLPTATPRGQQQSHPSAVIDFAHLPTVTLSEAEVRELSLLRAAADLVHLPPTALNELGVSDCFALELWFILFTYKLMYNAQRARSQQLSRRRIMVDPVHLPPIVSIGSKEPEVSNCLHLKPWLILFTYRLQSSTSKRLANCLVAESWQILFAHLLKYSVNQKSGIVSH